MTLVKYRIPPREVFDRYAPPVRYNLIKGYHRKLTEKHRWYVRSLDDYFYCDGERPNIPAVEIFDCDWSPDEWDKRPYRHFYNPIQKAWYESYAHEGYPPLSEYDYGFTREDSLVLRNGEPFVYYFRIHGKMAAEWRPMDEGSPLRLMYNGIHSRAYNDEIKQGVFMDCEPVKKTNSDVITPILRELYKKKYRDFYNNMAKEIIKRFNIPSNQI